MTQKIHFPNAAFASAALLGFRALPPKHGGEADFLVVLLHGYGANGADLLDLAWYWRDLLPTTEFISTDAPEPCELAPDQNLGEFSSRQWFSLAGVYDGTAAIGDQARSQLRPRAEKSRALVAGFLQQILTARHLPPQRLALVGFSQGTMMSLATALEFTPSLAGVVGYSGALLAENAEALQPKSRPPILLIHGQEDTVVPFTALAQAEKTLRTAGLEVQTLARPHLGHGIDEIGLQAGGDFLRQCADAKP